MKLMLSVKCFQYLKARKNCEGFKKSFTTSVTGEKSQTKPKNNTYLCNRPPQSINSAFCIRCKNYLSEELNWKLSIGVLPHWPQNHICLRALTAKQAGMHEWCLGMALVNVMLTKTCLRTHQPWNTQFPILSSSVSPQVNPQITVTCFT